MDSNMARFTKPDNVKAIGLFISLMMMPIKAFFLATGLAIQGFQYNPFCDGFPERYAGLVFKFRVVWPLVGASVSSALLAMRPVIASRIVSKVVFSLLRVGESAADVIPSVGALPFSETLQYLFTSIGVPRYPPLVSGGTFLLMLSIILACAIQKSLSVIDIPSPLPISLHKRIV